MKSVRLLWAGLLVVSAAWADTPINENAPASKTGTVHISNVAGSVVVTGWDKEEVAVTGTLGEGSKKFEFTPGPERTELRVVVPKHARHVKPSHLNVSVPAGSRVETETVSADVELSGIAGEVSAESVSGHQKLAGTMPRVDAESVSGDIEVTAADTNASATSVSGDIDVVADTGTVSVETVSGDARIDVATLRRGSFESVSGDVKFNGNIVPDGELRVETLSGNFEGGLPADASARVHFESFSGNLDGRDFGISGGKEAEATLGQGGSRIILDSFSGSAILKNIKVEGETRIRANKMKR